MTNTRPGWSSPGAPSRRSGRAALVLAIGLALGTAALLWWLADDHRRVLPPAPIEQPVAAPREPEPQELTAPPERRDVATPAEVVPGEPCHLLLQVLPPEREEFGGEPGPAFTGTALVRVRRSESSFTHLAELTASSPLVKLDCPAGEYEFTLERYGPEALGALPIRAVLEPGETRKVMLLLARLQALTGRLTSESAQDFAGVRIALARRGRTLAEARAESDGAFALAPLPVSDYDLVVGDPDGPLVPRREVDLGLWHGAMHIAVPVLLELEVRVLDEGGRPVAGARVEGLGARGGRVAGVTNASGSLRTRHLPPGRYELVASHDSVGHGEQELELGPEARAPVEIRLRPDIEEE